MFGFPTDLFGMHGGNNHRRSNSNSLVPQHHSLFGNSLMIPSPFGGMSSLFDNFGMNSSPFAMMDRMMRANNGSLFLGGNNNTNAPIHSFTSTTVMSYSGSDGRPKVYQESTSHSRGPGGIEETRQAVRDSERGINKVSSMLKRSCLRQKVL
jgi:myeloid leukemia factor 1